MSPRYTAIFAALWLSAVSLLLVPVARVRAEPAAKQAPLGCAAEQTPSGCLPALVPPENGYDWLEMYNGEWLKGWITSMRNGTLIFESENFSELYPDWSSVIKLYTGLPHTFVLRDRTVLVALAALENGKLRVGDRVLSPRQVLLISPGGVHEWDHWDFNIRSGFTFYISSSSQLTWSNSVWVNRDDGVTRSSLSYDGALGQVDGDLTVNSHTGSLKIGILITDRLYALPFFGSLRHDLEQNIALRTTVGGGAGVRIIDADAGSWDFDLGPAYISTLPISTEAGPVERDQDLGIVLNTHAKFDIAKDVTVSASWMSAFALTGVSRSYHHGTAVLDFELTSVFSLDLSLVFDRIEQATTTEDGRVPAQNELQVVIGLGVKF